MIDEIDPALAIRQRNAIILTGIGIAVLFYPVLSWLIIYRDWDPVFRAFLSRVIIWATLPAVYQYAVKVEGRDFLLWKEQPRNLLFYILAIFALFALIYISLIVASIPRKLGFHDNDLILKRWDTLLRKNTWLLIFTCITAGFTEELLVRAYILPRLSLVLKSQYLPILFSALIFSALHLGYWNLSEIIFTLLFGLVCGTFYYKYRNIQVLIIFHALYDFLVLFKPSI